MSQCFKLFDLPDSSLKSPTNNNIQLASEYIAWLNDSGLLIAFSLAKRTTIFQADNVTSFLWVSNSVIQTPILVLIQQNSVKYIQTGIITESVPFDTQKRISAFSINQLNESPWSLSDFPVQLNPKYLFSTDLNSFVLLDDQNSLHQYLIFPDGIYSSRTTTAKDCTKFVSSGVYFAGHSNQTIHIWTSTLEYVNSVAINGPEICAVDSNQFAVINNDQKFIEFVSIKNDNSIIIEKVDLTSATTFVAIENGKILTQPPNTSFISQTYFLPIFATDKEVVTFENEVYLQRIIASLPTALSIPILSTRSNNNEEGTKFAADTLLKIANPKLVETFLDLIDVQTSLSFLNNVILINQEQQDQYLPFIKSIQNIINSYCIKNINEKNSAQGFSTVMVNLRNLFSPMSSVDPKSIPEIQPKIRLQAATIKEDKLISFVLRSLDKRQITQALPTLKQSFGSYSPFELFRTLVLQQAWLEVCSDRFDEAKQLIVKLGEDPLDHFYGMWKNTTRNQTRNKLYVYLCKEGRIKEGSEDEQNAAILKKITDAYPNTSFLKAQNASASPAARAFDDTKLPQWQPIVDLNQDFDENRSMIFRDLFKIPEEPNNDNSSNYFVGNIALIEAQHGKDTLKMLTGDQDPIQKLWIQHCEHKINELVQSFESELEKKKAVDRNQLDCIKFVDEYYNQMNTYELETLLDILCKFGYFAQHEQDNFELLLVRICKNKHLFDTNWWDNQAKIDFGSFFKEFAHFCAKKSLFMPFEMFVISHKRAKNEDISDVKEPLINFIWDLWIKRNPSAATLSCMQFIAKSDSTDPKELWSHLPNDSLAPLASYVWNKDPTKFQPGSEETEILSARLKNEYPLLSSLVKGEIPHPQGPKKEPPQTNWRSPIFTSKYDLELHDLIQEHFRDLDFSKVFTKYYGQTPGQPDYPHFDHPELITAPVEPPYVHYVKSMLPVSAFQQAVEDGVDEVQFKKLCVQCLEEALTDKQIRLAVLSFIELVDIKFKLDYAIDYKLAIALYDILAKPNGSNEDLVSMLINVYSNKDKKTAKELQERLAPNDIELFLLSTLLGVRCGLPLDEKPIEIFASNAKAAELLLFIDRAAELGAHYPIANVEKIVSDKMPQDNPLKTHLLFHLKQSLPNEEGSSSTDIPALVVYRAVKRTDQPQDISLLQEALNRKVQLYALLATSIKGADLMLCALVTMLTMIEGPSTFDVTNPPDHQHMIELFLQTLSQLLDDNKSLELMQTLELFSENSIVVNLVHFYRSIELFAFRRAESVLPELNAKLSQGDTIDDDLIGQVPIKAITDLYFPMLDKLVKHCTDRSQIHVFRFLQVLDGAVVSPFLEPRVKLCKVISGFDNFRRAVVHCDLLGSPDKIVNDLVLNHSLQLGQAAAECLGISAAAATKQWLTFQYSNAVTPTQILEIHEEIVPSLQNADPMFFIYLFTSLLPYEQPTYLIPILAYARSIYKEDPKDLDALLLHLNLCKENKIEVQQSPGGLPSLSDLLTLLFPRKTFQDAPTQVPLSIASPVLYGLDTLQRFFESSIDKAIDVCLDKRESDNAHLICEWRNRDPHNIQLLEAVQSVISGEKLSPENQKLIEQFGNPTDDLDGLLQSIAKANGWRFVLISLHYKAAKFLNLPTTNLLHRKTSEFVESKLSINTNNWELVRELISTSKMASSEVALCLAHSYANHVQQILSNGQELQPNELSPEDYGDTFMQFTKLCQNPTAVGQKLFEIAKGGCKVQLPSPPTPTSVNQQQQDDAKSRSKLYSKIPNSLNPLLNLSTTNEKQAAERAAENAATHSVNSTENTRTKQEILPVSVVVNLLLHSSLCTTDIDESAELLDALLDELTNEPTSKLIIDIVSKFPDPALIPRYFQYLIANKKLDELPHGNLNEKVGRVIMNCARHHHPFEPEKYFDLTMKYNLFRDHAELQMECGNKLLENNPDKSKLEAASRNFLLALAYFLHEKCYSLSMECLKKLSLISLQMDKQIPVLQLDKIQVQQLMNTKPFSFALTVAVAYDMDNETNWAEAIYNQSIKSANSNEMADAQKDNEKEDFLTAFQYFRPITSTLCDGVVKKYINSNPDTGQQDRMKNFLRNIPNLVERYRIAKSLEFKDEIENMKAHNPVVCEWCERVLMNKQ